MAEVRHFVAPAELEGARLDVALTRLAPDLTRARVQRLVAEGRVRLAGRAAKAAARLRAGQPLEVEIPEPEPSGPAAQTLPCACCTRTPTCWCSTRRRGWWSTRPAGPPTPRS